MKILSTKQQTYGSFKSWLRKTILNFANFKLSFLRLQTSGDAIVEN